MRMRAIVLRLHDDLDAAVLLGAEGLVELWALFESSAMRDDEGWVDLALLHPLKQLRQVMLHRGLGHSEREAAVDRRSHRDLVQQTAVDPDDRNRSEIATAMDGLPQHVRAVCTHEGRDLN